MIVLLKHALLAVVEIRRTVSRLERCDVAALWQFNRTNNIITETTLSPKRPFSLFVCFLQKQQRDIVNMGECGTCSSRRRFVIETCTFHEMLEVPEQLPSNAQSEKTTTTNHAED